MTEQKNKCDNCGEEAGSTQEIKGQNVCEDCVLKDYVPCNNCTDLIHKDDQFYFDSLIWCEDCLNSETFRCENCGEAYYNDFYEEDGRCRACFRNTGFQEIKLKFSKEKSKTFNKNPYKNYCGVEIEALNNKLDDSSFNYEECEKYGFSQVYDGSLEEGLGVEFVSNAFNGDLLINKINDFCKELRKRGFYIAKECGLHIHIGTPKNIKSLQKISLFYAKYEKQLFNMLPVSRRYNNYCRTLGYYKNVLKNTPHYKNLQELKEDIYQCKDKKYLKYYIKQKYNDARYSWVNLHSVFYRGTIEIRNHSGTIQADKIIKWLKIHLTILNTLKDIPFNVLLRLPNTDELFLSFFDFDTKKYIIKRWARFNPSFVEPKPDSLINLDKEVLNNAILEGRF